MGIVLTFVIEATDSTLSAVLMHFIINCNSLVLAYVSAYTGQKMSIDEEVDMTLEQVLSWGMFALIALVVSILVYIELAKSTNRIEHIKSEVINIKAVFDKKKHDDKNCNIEENQIEKESISLNNSDKEKVDKIIDAYLLIAMFICIVYMICVEVM
jgi:hypothetical protein